MDKIRDQRELLVGEEPSSIATSRSDNKSYREQNEVINNFPVARKITTDTFFLGTSPVITDEQLDYVEKTVDAFFK